MRRPAIVAWVGFALGILAGNGNLKTIACVSIALGFAWIASEVRRTTALLLAGIAFSAGCILFSVHQNNDRIEQPLRVTAIGHVDRYSALSENKMVLRVSSWERAEKPGTTLDAVTLPETFCVVFKPSQLVEVGAYYQVTMVMFSASPPRNPGMFDYGQFLDSRGIDFQAEVESIEPFRRKPHRWISIRETMRQKIQRILLKRLGPSQGELAAAMILGDTADLDPELLGLYRQTGTAHILAVSGLHFGILFTGAEMLLDRLKLPYHLKKLILAVLILSFLGLTGLKSSAMRAAGMLFLAGFNQMSGRQYDRLSSLALAGTVILAFRPVLLFDVGYQMTMAAVYGIGAVLPALTRPGRTVRGLAGRVKDLTDTFALSFSVFLSVALPSIWHFNTLTLLSVVINLPVVFLTGLALPLAFLTIPLDPLPLVPDWAGWTAGCLLAGTEAVVHLAEGITAQPYMTAGTPGVLKGAGAAGLLMMFALRRMRRDVFNLGRFKLLAAAGCTAAILMLLPLETWLHPVDQVRFFDVGQGDAALLRTRYDERILIDTGDGRAFREMDQLLLKSGISKLTLMVLTHPHQDHIGGAEAILRHFEVGGLILSGAAPPEAYEDILEVAGEQGIEVMYVRKGDWIELKSGRLDVLSPPEGIRVMEANAASVVLLYSAGDFSFLFTGDITKPQEYAIIEQLPEKKMVLKVAHHGSKSSTSKEFVSSLDPGLALISVGKNSFGHPGEATLMTLKEHGFQMFRTDLNGCVDVKTDGSALYVKRMLSPP